MSADSSGAVVTVVGGGLSGVACARRLHDAGQAVRVLERGHRLGGRMSVRTEQFAGRPHPVDLGAPYFTVRDPGFAAVVQAWEKAGLARPWTDTFTLAGPAGRTGTTTGPQRWSSSTGLRGLVEKLAEGLDVRLRHEVTSVQADDGVPTVDGEPARAAVLAMPDPQAARLLSAEAAHRIGIADRAWSPVLTVWSAWPQRWWAPFDGIFVDSSEVISWVADSGRSRGDGAPVLVAHTTSTFAQTRLDDVQAAIAPVLAELPRVLGGELPAPAWSQVHRWSLASSRDPHPEPFALNPDPADGLIGVCGDAWGERSRVEQAWLSGDALAGALLERLQQ